MGQNSYIVGLAEKRLGSCPAATGLLFRNLSGPKSLKKRNFSIYHILSAANVTGSTLQSCGSISVILLYISPYYGSLFQAP